MDLNKIFVDKGVYKSKRVDEGIFLCEALEGNSIGKLVWYKDFSPGVFERTNISYFLNCYLEDDMKEVLINRENYDMVGKLDCNYLLNNNFIVKSVV